MKRIFFLMALMTFLLAGCYSPLVTVAEQPPSPTPTIVPTPSPTPAPTPTPVATPSPTPEPSPEPYVPRPPIIALSFDDGPSNHTERILDVLEKHGGRATFFVLGYRVEPRRNTIIRALDMGNEIVGHTWGHPDLTQLSDADIMWELQATSEVIEAVTGYSPNFFRPPFGRTNGNVRRISEELGYAIVNWTLDTVDWRDRNPDIIYETIMSQVEDGAVILLHDIHLTTAQAMERVIPSLVEQGFQLVTVSEVLEYVYGELEPGMIYGKIYDDELNALEESPEPSPEPSIEETAEETEG